MSRGKCPGGYVTPGECSTLSDSEGIASTKSELTVFIVVIIRTTRVLICSRSRYLRAALVTYRTNSVARGCSTIDDSVTSRYLSASH